MDKLLRYDHQERLTAKEAQAHPYFGKSLDIMGFFPPNHLTIVSDPVRAAAGGAAANGGPVSEKPVA